ncbi:hypothetical protein C8Z91_28300 [Paenibacillus elgii]|uniref:Uncharacterized protein n=1 Tax=Paenibacillus elgii TaxID=189691 RepID=A0A2T6FVE4_9BACL|nr:hypothetical protein [Paenibacillus elgii]PUA35876.1 hypothetical protein C8Z91_28300 [Paenibacillus elgii]
MLLREQHRQVIVMIVLGLFINTFFSFSASSAPLHPGGDTAAVAKTETPTIYGDVYDYNFELRGRSEPDATLTLTRSDGTYKVTTAREDDGVYWISFDPYWFDGWRLKAGEELTLSAEAPGKTVSDTVYITVLPSVPTSMPTVTGSIYANGGWLSGTTEPDKPIWIILNNSRLFYVASTSTKNGSYTMELDKRSYFLKVGEKLQLTSESRIPGIGPSDPVTVTVLPLEGKTAAPTVPRGVYERSLSGFAEPGSFVTIQRASGSELTERASKENGAFSARLGTDAYDLGESLKLTAEVYGKKVSDPVYVTVTHRSPKSPVPTVSGNVYTNGFWISGRTEPNTSGVIHFKRANGSIVTRTWITDGSYSKKRQAFEKLVPMEKLYVTAMADGKKESDPVPLTVLPTSGKTAAPAVIGNVDVVKGILKGKAETGSIIRVKRPDEEYDLWSEEASETDGSFSMDLSWHSLRAGERLTLTAETIGKGISDEVHFIVQPAP